MVRSTLETSVFPFPLRHDDLACVQGRHVMATLLSIGWQLKRQSGSHRTLAREGWPDFVFAFHDGDEIGPRMLSRIAKRTGLQPSDL